MKYFYRFILIVILSTSLNYGQEIETRMEFNFKGVKFYKDLNSIRNYGFGAKVDFIYPVFNDFSLEVKPGLFYSIGDYYYSGFECGAYISYTFYYYIKPVIGINWEFSNIYIGDKSVYSGKGHKLTDAKENFAEIYAGFRLGSEKLGLNLGYLFPLIDKIAVHHTYVPYLGITDVYIKGTIQVGLDIRLFTIRNLF